MDATARARGRRATDIDQIKAVALRQLAQGGLKAVSLNAIARQLDVTGPALYRYVSSRDALIRLLLLDAFDDFTAALQNAARAARRPEAALRAAARAYRSWAHANPVRYQLMMGDSFQQFDPGEAVTERAMAAFSVLLDLVANLVPANGADVEGAATRGWVRLHGFVSLENAGHLSRVTAQPDRLFRAEVNRFIAELIAGC